MDLLSAKFSHCECHALHAQVDFSAVVSEEFLERLGLEKGKRTVVGHEERSHVLRALDGESYKVSAGGSLSNTLVALARLGMSHTQAEEVRVAMTGSVGSDPLGDFYRYVNSQHLNPSIIDKLQQLSGRNYYLVA